MPPPSSRSCCSSSRARIDRTDSSGARTGARSVGIPVDTGPARSGVRPRQGAGRGPHDYSPGTAHRRHRQPVPGLPGAFSRFAHLLALWRRPGATDAAGGEGMATASGSPAGIGRRRRWAGTGACSRGAGHPKYRQRGGLTVTGSLVEDCARGVTLVFAAAVACFGADSCRPLPGVAVPARPF